jgi:predicted DNA-binding transcriptional regulator YafY
VTADPAEKVPAWADAQADILRFLEGTIMRADRLLSLLMLLQTRGRLTARELASEMEVTERTIYRDLTALSAAGVPVYTERGPGGGISLIEEYRTSLTGLNSDEVRALFMLSVPAPLKQLGLGQQFKAALLKLSAALPDSRRAEQDLSRQRILLDSSWWFQSGEVVPCLQTVQQALWQNRPLRLQVRWDFFNTCFEQEAEPYGLVAKASVWYLVYGRAGNVQVTRLSQVIEAEILPGAFIRPVDFNLVVFWETWCKEYETKEPYLARVRLSPAVLPTLQTYLEERSRLSPFVQSASDTQGWVTLELPFESFVSARTHLLGLGRAVEVLAPEQLRKSLVDFAEQIVGFYRDLNSSEAVKDPLDLAEAKRS